MSEKVDKEAGKTVCVGPSNGSGGRGEREEIPTGNEMEIECRSESRSAESCSVSAGGNVAGTPQRPLAMDPLTPINPVTPLSEISIRNGGIKKHSRGKELGVFNVRGRRRLDMLGLKQLPQNHKELSIYNFRLGFANLVFNWANMQRTKFLAHVVRKDHSQVSELVEQVAGQSDDLAKLSEDCTAMNKKLDERNGKVDKVLHNFAKQVERQNTRIEEQKNAVEQLIASRFQRDAVVDASIVAVSGILTQSPFVALPVRLALVVFPARVQHLGAKILQILAFLQLAKTLRSYAQHHGAHNGIGNPTSYLLSIIRYLREETHKVMRSRSREVPSPDGNVGRVEAGVGRDDDT